MPLKCTYNRILVKPDPTTETSSGGILIPQASRSLSRIGTVVNVGPGIPKDSGIVPPCCVNEGDRIIFNRNIGLPLTINREEYIILSDSEAVAVIEGSDIKELKVGADAQEDILAQQQGGLVG